MNVVFWMFLLPLSFSFANMKTKHAYKTVKEQTQSTQGVQKKAHINLSKEARAQLHMHHKESAVQYNNAMKNAFLKVDTIVGDLAMEYGPQAHSTYQVWPLHG